MASSTSNQQSINDTMANLSDIMADTSAEFDLFRDLLFGDKIAELADARERLAGVIQQIGDAEELTKLIEPVIAESIHIAVSKSGELVSSAIAPIIDASIQKKIQQDKSAISRTLGPIISEAISNQIDSSRDEIAAVLAPVISGAITRQVIESPDEIIRALSPIMGAAIKAQVRDQRDEVIDALYPVIGSTVARYIKNLFDSINRKLQNTFTIETLMHKIRAKIRGVSEAQLMFTESLRFDIRAAFLIHQSGLLITQVHPPGQQIMESEMVAGMLTAIRSFVNEWIEQSDVASEIDQIEYGTSKIILEPIGGFGYLVTVGEGEPHEKFRNQMHTTSNYIGEQFGDNIREFDGNTSMVPEAIRLAMEELIGGKLLFSMGLEFQTDLNEGEPVWEGLLLLADWGRLEKGSLTGIHRDFRRFCDRFAHRFSFDPSNPVCYNVGDLWKFWTSR